MCNGHYQSVNWQRRGDWGHDGWGGHHMHHRGGWGTHRMHHHGGFFIAPFFMLAFGMFLLFMVFKSGLWIPLLVVGSIFWAMKHHHWHNGEWGGGWHDKRKRGYGPMWGGEPDEKRKNDEYI